MTTRVRKSNRLQNYDYFQAGYYFVTICTQNRKELFGEIVDSQMVTNTAGEMVIKTWNELPKFYHGIQMDQFQIMPNHVHGIIVIVEDGPRAVPNEPRALPDGQPQGVVPTITRKVELMEHEKIVLVGVTDIFFYTKIRDAFKPAGYGLKRVTSPDQILEKAKAHAPTAIVLNMNDPGLDATTMLKIAKSETALNRVPVLAFANHEEVDTWRQAKELGIDKIVSRNEFSARTLALLQEVTQPPA